MSSLWQYECFCHDNCKFQKNEISFLSKIGKTDICSCNGNGRSNVVLETSYFWVVLIILRKFHPILRCALDNLFWSSQRIGVK